jgi:8-oxo-dGTP diphosphatase
MAEALPFFNVRIYGIFFSRHGLLVSDEIQYGRMITKFPGGGLKFGEGTIDCVKREFREELAIEIEILDHFYTVDFFQPSTFHEKQQVISIYYFINSDAAENIKVAEKPFDFPEVKDKAQVFRWVKEDQIAPDHFTLPIDQHVAGLLRTFLADKKQLS